MLEESVKQVVRNYLAVLQSNGISCNRAVVFGSHVKGRADEWSDIDVVVIAPELESPADKEKVDTLWRQRLHTDPRIEPIPCGVREWSEDGGRPILEIARLEGEKVCLTQEMDAAVMR